MIGFYKKLFFKFYSSNLKSWNESSPAAAQAFAAVLMYLTFNVFSLLQLSDSILNTKFLVQIFDIDKLTYIAILASLILVLWFSFIFNGKYKNVIEECENLKQTSEQKRRWTLYFRIYEGASIVILVLCFITSPIAIGK